MKPNRVYRTTPYSVGVPATARAELIRVLYEQGPRDFESIAADFRNPHMVYCEEVSREEIRNILQYLRQQGVIRSDPNKPSRSNKWSLILPSPFVVIAACK